jgi:predicted phosphodiesterase
MLLLQVADIHFRHPDCGSDMDPERPYRTALVNDLRRQVATMGPVSAILVAGDIAYQGRSEEYDAALAWLTELTQVAGCTLGDVFVVPGNHDVDRSLIKSSRAVQNAQAAVATAVAQRREREVIDQFRDAQAGHALLAPLEAYNRFAARFNCQVYAPEKLRWHQERKLSDEFRLRIYGLTSTLLSGAGAPQNKEDTRLTLYLGPFQTAIDPSEGVVNLVMCHHPPDWFIDQDDADDAIKGRAALHLFGHKHRQRMHRDATYVRFSAGAVNPERHEPGWEPGYNLVSIKVVEDQGNALLDVEAHLFCWQTNPDCFRPKVAEDHRPFFLHRIPLVRPRLSAPLATSVPPTPPTPGVGGANPATANNRVDAEVAMSEPRTRNLVFRFWNLASSQRREIAKKFDLISDEEMKLAEPERYGRALVRARERGLLEAVAAEVARLEGT